MDQAAWTRQPFENLILERLGGQIGQDNVDTVFARYINARDNLPPIWEQIRGSEPFLSDHGPRHIKNVFDNTHRLIPDNDGESPLSGLELYLLGLMVLFHDVGNIHGRADHNAARTIAKIYDHIQTGPNLNPQEKNIVIKAASAHTGTAHDGSRDTLHTLPQTLQFLGYEIRVQTLGAILRLADELAEGPQRTVEYMRQNDLFDKTSRIYHDYASVTDAQIDPGNERISLHYHIPLPSVLTDEKFLSLEELLSFVFKRLLKLDQERKYARYYCGLLAPFKSVHAQFDFWYSGWTLDTDLEPLVLDDKIIPGESHKTISDINPAYDMSQLLETIKQCCQDLET